MIKECKVVMNNGLNMVILFDGAEVQMPSVKTGGKTVFVKCEKGKFSVVTKSEYEKSLESATKKENTKAKRKAENPAKDLVENEG